GPRGGRPCYRRRNGAPAVAPNAAAGVLLLDDANVAGAWTLTPWVGLGSIAHAVALPQLLERHPVQRTAVEEHVFASVRRPDEAKATIGNGFDSSLCHG